MARQLSLERPAYRDQKLLKHYIRLFELLEGEDTDLALAGFLHGCKDLELLATLPVVQGRSVVAILRDWRRLRSFSGHEPGLGDRLSGSILPSLREPRAAILATYDALDQLDSSKKELAGFCRGFHVLKPRPVPVIDESQLPLTSQDRLAEKAVFAGIVASQAARYCGLWLERNLAEDVALYHLDRARFEEAVEIKAKHHDAATEMARTVGDAVRSQTRSQTGLETLRIHWEWHHVATLDRLRRKADTHPLSAAILGECGSLVFILDEPSECYQVLGAIHKIFKHRQSLGIEDSIGRPSRSGYEVIQSAIFQDGDPWAARVLIAPSIKVRIMPRKSWNATYSRDIARTIKNTLASLQTTVPPTTEPARSLEVYSHDGRSWFLFPGSTVLDLCCELDERYVAYATGAVINGARADLLQKLRMHDVVRIEVGDQPRNGMPHGWRDFVPPGSAQVLEDLFDRYTEQTEVNRGRNVLRDALSAQIPEIRDRDQAAFDTLVEDCIGNLGGPDGVFESESVHGLFRRAARQNLSRSEVEVLSSQLHHLLKRGDDVALDLLEVPTAFVSHYDSIRLCPVCRPKVGAEVGGVLDRQARVLVVHSIKHKKCGGQSEPMEWKRQYSRGQYFLIEMESRNEVLSGIVSAATRSGVQIIEYSGANLAPGWSLLRLHVRSMLGRDVELVRDAFERINGVLKVHPPGARLDSTLEGYLPARAVLRNPYAHTSDIFLAGPPIADDDRFYGRDGELHFLESALETSRERGVMVLITGPLKVGKSSLARKFLRKYQDNWGFVVATAVAVEVPSTPEQPFDPWHEVEGLIRKQLMAAIGGLTAPNPFAGQPVTIEAMIEHVAGRRRVILFIDEVFVLAGDLNFIAWTQRIKRIRNTLLLVSGPKEGLEFCGPWANNRVSESRVCELSPMDPDVVGSLLSARKLNHRSVRIRVDEAVARRACRDTGGNPYWCNALGEIFARSIDLKRSVFDMSRYEAALETLAFQDRFFMDRIKRQGADNVETVRFQSFLRLLAREKLSHDEVRHFLSELGCNPSEAEEMVRRLEYRGSIIHRGSTTLISTPLLALHISKRAKFGKE